MTDRTSIMSKLSKVAKKTLNKKHVAGIVVLLLTFSMFFSVIAVLQPGGPFGHARGYTVSGNIKCNIGIGWYNNYGTWTHNEMFMLPGSSVDRQYFDFDVAAAIGSGKTITNFEIHIYVSNDFAASYINLVQLPPFTNVTYSSTNRVWPIIAKVPTPGALDWFTLADSSAMDSYAAADYAAHSGHVYFAFDSKNMTGGGGFGVAGDLGGGNAAYVIVTYTAGAATWAPTITSTPPAGPNAVLNETIITPHYVYGSGNYTPTADSFTYSVSPNSNYGSQTNLAVYWSATVYMSTYLRWNLAILGIPSNATINGAYLHLYAYANGQTVRLYQTAATDWGETIITYNNAPATVGSPAGYSAPTIGNNNYTVTTFVNNTFVSNGKAYLAVKSNTNGPNMNQYYSKERTGTAQDPYLIVDWQYTWNTTSYTYDYVYVTGDPYSYQITTNETSTLTILSKPAWLTYSVGNTTLWGTVPGGGNESVNIRALSIAGMLYAYQNYTIVAWGEAPLLPSTWAPAITSSLVTTWTSNVAFSWTITWNESVIDITVETDAGWLTWNAGNRTLYGRTNVTGTPFTIWVNATSENGTLTANAVYTIHVAPLTETQKYLAWLSGSGVMFFIGTIGFIGMIGTPWFYFKYGQGDKSRRIVVAIGMWFFFFGLFYGSVVVFG